MQKLDKDILAGFQEESKQLVEELTAVVEKLEGRHAIFPSPLLEEFSQKIDRIMGAAQTLSMEVPDHLGLVRIGAIASLCKKLGYAASELKSGAFLPLFAAFWADTLEVLENLIENIEDESKSLCLAQAFSSVLQKRLEWLAKKVAEAQDKAHSSQDCSQIDVDHLLKGLGF